MTTIKAAYFIPSL